MKQMKLPEVYRQGDLLFMREDNLPDGFDKAPTVPDGIVAEGEATGHHHRVEMDPNVAVKALMGAMYIHALKDAVVKHQEHKQVDLPAGNWKVIRQNEYTPEGWRRVED